MVVGQGSIALYPKLKGAKYGPYKEAWHLLRRAAPKPGAGGLDSGVRGGAVSAASVVGGADLAGVQGRDIVSNAGSREKRRGRKMIAVPSQSVS
jgi:hypothetical protein